MRQMRYLGDLNIGCAECWHGPGNTFAAVCFSRGVDVRSSETQAEYQQRKTAECLLVDRLVKSQLHVRPRDASKLNWDRAWKDAAKLWTGTVQSFDHKLKRDTLDEAEARALGQLTMLARLTLDDLGWTDE